MKKATTIAVHGKKQWQSLFSGLQHGRLAGLREALELLEATMTKNPTVEAACDVIACLDERIAEAENAS